MRSLRRYSAIASAPPKPPTRTGTGCGTGARVRPASESITSRSLRGASRSASCRASVVPPRMRMRMSLPETIAPESAAPRRWLSIVGIGEDGVEGLTPVARNLITGAEIVFGGKRHLALAAPLIRGAARAWPTPFEGAAPEVLAQRSRQVCVLASGDPYLYGVGAVLARHVDPAETLVLPAPSAFSLAAARLGWALQDCALVSLHGRALGRLLAESGFGGSRLTVLEALGGPRERMRATTAAAFDLGAIDALNTVAIEVVAAPDARVIARATGLPDRLFEHDG